MADNTIEIVRVVIELVTLILIPVIVWLIKSTFGVLQRLSVLEQRMNTQVTGLAKIERKIDMFEEQLERKMAAFHSDIHAKIDIMTSLLNSYLRHNSKDRDNNED